MQGLKIKEHVGLLEARKGKKKDILPYGLQKGHWPADPLILGILTPRTVREKFLCYFKISCGHLLQQQKETNILPLPGDYSESYYSAKETSLKFSFIYKMIS